MSDQPDLAALLCSRLCHDLLSPVGAMNNGLELLADEDDPDMRERCVELLNESARAAADKLKFFRLAFGAAGGFGSEVDPAEAKNVVAALVTSDGRTKLDWQVPSELLPKPAVKILLNLVYIASDALVRGGTLHVVAERRADETELAIRGEGPRIALDKSIAQMLGGKSGRDQLDARNAAAFMTVDLARKSGGDVQIAETDEMVLLGAIYRH